ncbi:hypothetical protein SKC37_04370 [Aquirufa sp. HETE-83D]|jgi:hypothetical protein|uniref:DUF1330 domain-containing protein n=1 Tax=Aquirufa esocilacus TaxID=3096513 RepID=A0ABW6DGQ4_9BACT
MNRLQFYFKAQTAHGLHSPSIYTLYCEVLNPYLKGQLTYPQLIEGLRHHYSDCAIIEMEQTMDPAQISQNTVIVVKNPHAIEENWYAMYSHEAVIQTVDLFDLGLLFFKPICPKQHFYLRKMA